MVDRVDRVDSEWRDEAVARVGSERDAEAALTDLIRWLDLTVAEEDDWTGYRNQALTRMMIAAGRDLLTALPESGINVTIAAAEEYVLHPTDEAWEKYFRAATNTYPFGSGDGCYSIDPDGHGPGSGCTTGAGSLHQVALTIGAAAVMNALRREVVPWLEGRISEPWGAERR